MAFGILRITDYKHLDPAATRPPRTSLVEEYEDLIGAPKLPKTGQDWPRITRCFKSGSAYVISFSNPAQEGSIRFDPENSKEGVYNLKVHPIKLNEAGKVEGVREIPEKDTSLEAFAELKNFPIRFFVKTAAHDRQGTVRVWLVGISTVERAGTESA